MSKKNEDKALKLLIMFLPAAAGVAIIRSMPTDPETAELLKYLSYGFLISFLSLFFSIYTKK